MIELLAALALLGMLTAALAQWTQMTMRMASLANRNLPWDRAAAAALERVNEDLLVGDFAIPTEKRKGTPDIKDVRVEVLDDRLAILTRQDGRTVRREYVLDRNHLLREDRFEDGASERRMLLGDVAAFTLERDTERRSLIVRLVSTTERRQSRRFTLP